MPNIPMQPVRYGMNMMKPVCMVVKPSCLIICGMNIDRP